MKPVDLLALLRAIYEDKAALRRRHEVGARRVRGYLFNNTYQYIIAREDTHLRWLRDGIEALGGTPPDVPAASAFETTGSEREIISADLDALRAFIERWQAKTEAVTNARHRLMLTLMVGETLEQQRFLEQALEGRADLLGRRTSGPETAGSVVSTRWME